MAKAKTNYKSHLITEIELLPDELLREIIDFTAFLKERYKNELEGDVAFIKQRYERHVSNLLKNELTLLGT